MQDSCEEQWQMEVHPTTSDLRIHCHFDCSHSLPKASPQKNANSSSKANDC